MFNRIGRARTKIGKAIVDRVPEKVSNWIDEHDDALTGVAAVGELITFAAVIYGAYTLGGVIGDKLKK